MGCFRLGCAFISSLFVAAVFIAMGGFLGALAMSTTGAEIGGGIGAIIGLYLMVRIIRTAVKNNWLKKHGHRIIATVADIQRKTGRRQYSYGAGSNIGYGMQMYTYYVIIAYWTDPYTGRTYTFQSKDLNRNPNKKYAQGSNISVRIDPRNPADSYLVEV